MIDFEAGGESVEGRPPRLYFGKYPGVVLDNGPPAEGEHRGEIKVRVPGILEETPDGKDHQPLEVVAAPCFLPGFFFVPERDEHVWVEFVAGDINFPIWTGTWYPKDRSPRVAGGEEKAPTEHQKVIRTRSGMVIQLDDTDGKEKVIIEDGKGKGRITMDKDGITIAHGNSAITLRDDSVTISGEKIRLNRPA